MITINITGEHILAIVGIICGSFCFCYLLNKIGETSKGNPFILNPKDFLGNDSYFYYRKEVKPSDKEGKDDSNVDNSSTN